MTDNTQNLFDTSLDFETDNNLNYLHDLAHLLGPVCLDAEVVKNALKKYEDNQLILTCYYLSKQKNTPYQQATAFTSSPFIEPYDNGQEIVQTYQCSAKKKNNTF